MKKIELTERQKKVLKISAVIICGVVVGAKIINRTELGAEIKRRVIHQMIRSKADLNGRDFQMYTWISKTECPDSSVAEKAFKEAYNLWKSIILEAKNVG